MGKLSRMLTMSLIFFASMEPSTVMSKSCITNLGDIEPPDGPDTESPAWSPDTESPEVTKKPNIDRIWTLTVHFTSWTVNGTFLVNDFYVVDPKPVFKDNRRSLNSENNVTAVFRVKINSFIQGTMEVGLVLDNIPFVLNAADIEFHPVHRKLWLDDHDAVVPMVFSPHAGDPFESKVRGICYSHKCGLRPYRLGQELNYNLFIHCDRVQPYP